MKIKICKMYNSKQNECSTIKAAHSEQVHSSYTHWKDVKTKAFRNIKKIILVFSGKQARPYNLLNISSRCDYLGN